jgi:UDP-N-acetylmuramate dehydrogenase
VEILENVSLKQYAWWKIGGPADFFCLPESLAEIEKAVMFAKSRGLPITILGGGTNVLISDAGVEGLVICMRKLVGATVDDGGGGGGGSRIHITAWAGAPKAELTKIFMKRKLAPALFMCGLPGDVGGGVVMNAGVSEKIQPREFVEIVDWVEVLSLDEGKVRRFQRDELDWRYRHSSGWQPGIVVRVGLSWPMEPDEEIPRKVKDATKNRLQRQPLDLPSCGSTFKNPKPVGGEGAPIAAGALIEQAGLKGYQVGGAQVSPKHANFIVNIKGDATAADVSAVISHVRSEVKRQFGVDLETEVKLLGRW